MSILPAFVPEVGIDTCTAFGTVTPAVTFNDDVVGAPVASPGRTEMNPFAVAPTAVTFSNTPVAPMGTTTLVPVAVVTEPVTCSFCATGDTNGPARPRFTGSRVSRMRSGETLTIVDSAGPGAA